MNRARGEIFKPLYDANSMATTDVSRGWSHQLVAFTKAHGLDAICHRVLDDPELLAEVAARSYRHQNGFDKIILFEDAAGALIKLDVWWGDNTGWGEIHNHRFDFSSIVLHGTLRTRHYLRTEPGDGEGVRIARMVVPRQGDQIDSVDGGMVLGWEGEQTAGSYYDMDCRLFHQVSGAPDELTVTFVAQGQARRNYSEVVTELTAYQDVPYFTPAELAAKLRRLADLRKPAVEGPAGENPL
ncbi:hypothetical protein [Kribbella solani]|uniref:Cysteine dioxygenase n=1 Tax=Kribbella solani TaxID=236067 RepID=A0A841DMA6_9ACTN|nr:hypothetical protein [Kribbella solani]MBB5977790.1 hypothetical protein [Kribbella solani]